MSVPESQSWRAMLRARPVRNTAASISEQADGTVDIGVKTKSPAAAVPLLSWVVPARPRRTTQLDGLGAQVWRLCDGGRTVEEIVDEFARQHRLTFHESRVAVTGYLKDLVQRGALAMVSGSE